MQITTIAKDIAATSTLPTFESYFKSLVDPNLITVSDAFDANVANHALSAHQTAAKSWETLGSSGALWTVYQAGYIATKSDAVARALLTHNASGKVYAAIEWQAGYVGLLIRAADSTNYVQITLATASGGVRVEKVVEGANTLLSTKSLTLTAGKIYHFAVEYDANNIYVYVDNQLITSVADTSLNTNTKIGVVTSVTANKIYEIVAR